MKYTIEGFSQEVALEYGFDVKDLVFLRWLVDFHSTGIMEKHFIDGKEYSWLSYQYAIDQVPLLGITSSDALGKRLKGLAKVLELKVTSIGGAGKKTCFRFKEEVLIKLLSSKAPDPKVGCHTVQKSGATRCKSRVQYDSSINDSSINDSKAFKPSAAVEEKLKEVEKKGFKIRNMIIKFQRRKKLLEWPPDSLLLEVCAEYFKPSKPIRNTYGWFKSVMEHKISRYGAARSQAEHKEIKNSCRQEAQRGMASVGDILTTLSHYRPRD